MTTVNDSDILSSHKNIHSTKNIGKNRKHIFNSKHSDISKIHTYIDGTLYRLYKVPHLSVYLNNLRTTRINLSTTVTQTRTYNSPPSYLPKSTLSSAADCLARFWFGSIVSHWGSLRSPLKRKSFLNVCLPAGCRPSITAL